MSGFRSKFAHTSKLGALNLGNRDIKPLADLIASEKAILLSTARLSNDTRKAAEALRDYGNAEGDDLADILPKVGFLFEQLAKAENKYSEHISTYRLFFKTLRTREESLQAMKKAKDALVSRIESAEKQLAKTGPEHKERTARESKVYELKQQLVGSENAVINEEARLGDFKRETVRQAMGLKLGAMIELSERTSIIGEMCRLLVAEVPAEKTTPGQQRPMYTSHSTTEEVMQEAQNCLSSVVFNPVSNADLAQADNSFGQTSDVQYAEQYDPRISSTGGTAGTDLSHSDNSGNEGPPQLPPLRSNIPDYRNERHQDMPESPARHVSTLGPPLLPPVLHSNNSFGGASGFDQRSSLAYMEGPDHDPVPIQFSRQNNHLGEQQADTPSSNIPASPLGGPPAAYNAALGMPRHGIRGDQGTSYDYDESAHWVRNNSGPPAPISFPPVPEMPPHIQHATIPEAPEAPVESRPTLPEPIQQSYQSTSYQTAVTTQDYSLPGPSRSYITDAQQIQEEPESTEQVPSPSTTTRTDTTPTITQTPYFPPMPTKRQSYSSNKPPAVQLSDPPRSPRIAGGPKSPRPLPEAPSRSPSLSQATPRPGVPRGASALGSKHGFDDPSYQPAKDTNNLSQNSRFPLPNMSVANSQAAPNTNAPPIVASGYSYHRADPAPAPPNGRFTAAAFRKSTNSTTSSGGGQSEAAKIREAWLAQSAKDQERDSRLAREQQEQETMRQQAAQAAQDRQDRERQNAEEAPSVAPLKLNKSRPVSAEERELTNVDPTSPSHPPPPAYSNGGQPSPSLNSSTGFSNNRYVTRLD